VFISSDGWLPAHGRVAGQQLSIPSPSSARQQRHDYRAARIPEEGAPSVLGSLVFGIGSARQQWPWQATVIPIDLGAMFTTKYPTTATQSLLHRQWLECDLLPGQRHTHIQPASARSTRSLGLLLSHLHTKLTARILDYTGQVGLNVNFRRRQRPEPVPVQLRF